MKFKYTKLSLAAKSGLIAAGSSLLAISSASAQTDLFWDANGGSAGTGGTGTWGTASTWRTGSAVGTLGNWSDTNNAIFGGTAGTVTIAANVIAQSLVFDTAGYTIARNSATSTLSLTINGSSANHGFFVNQNATISAVIAGTSGLIKRGNGTLTLSGNTTAAQIAASFTGPISVNVGILEVTGTGTAVYFRNDATVTLNIASGATFRTERNNTFGSGQPLGGWTIAGTFTANGTTGQTMPASVILNNGTMNGSSTSTDFGAFLNVGTTITANGTTNTISAPRMGMNTLLTLNTPLAGDALAISSQLGATSVLTGGVTKNGLGTVTLSGVNTYTGITTVSAGKLTVSSTGRINTSSSVSIGAGNFNYNSATALSQGVSFSGTGGTLSGTGTITPSVIITAGNTLAKGNSIGTQAYLGNLTLAGNDDIELGNSTGAGTYASPYNSDLGNVSGNLTLGGTLNVINNAGADGNGSISAGSYKIYTYLGTTSGSYATINNVTGYRADIVNNGAGNGSGQGIYLDNYRVAAAASTQTVTLNTRTGVAVSASLNITNANNSTAPYQERLGTTGFSGTTSGYTATGSATGIAGGASGSGSLSVGVSAGTVGTAGTYSGSTTLGLQTEEVNSSGLGNAGVGNQTVTINVTAYDFASADFTKTAGDGSLTGGGLSYTLDFGNSLAINTNYTATLQLANGMFSVYKDSLQGVYGTVGGPFSETAGNFASLTSGGTDIFTVSFFSGSTGTFTDTLTFNGTSLNTPLGNSALSQINIGITATVIPEPRAALLGAIGLLALLRRRRN